MDTSVSAGLGGGELSERRVEQELALPIHLQEQPQ
jgi:hypothetical protein